MNEQSSKPTSPPEVMIQHNKKLVTNWTVGKEQDLIPKLTYTEKVQVERPKPVFDNKVDEIIDTLEHDNDGPYFEEQEFDYRDKIARDIAKDIDAEIMKSIMNATDKEILNGYG